MAMIRIRAIKPDGSTYWPEEFPIELLQEIRAEIGGIRFASEYQCSPIDMSGNFLKREWLTPYISPPTDENGIPQLSYYFGVDPSITGSGDYCVICVLGKSANDKLYLVDFIRKQARLEDQIQMITIQAQKYMPKIINIESNAAQELFVQLLENTTTLPVRRSLTIGRKEDRFAAMSIHFQSGRCFVRGEYVTDEITNRRELTYHSSMKEFVLEWVAYRPKADAHDDTLDALEKALEVATFSLSPVSVNADAPTATDVITLAGQIGQLLKDPNSDKLDIHRKQMLLQQMRERAINQSQEAQHAKQRRFRMFR